MDVEAVVFIVIRKLTDLLMQESIIFNKATNEVEQVRISLRQMQNFLIDAEDKKDDDELRIWQLTSHRSSYQDEGPTMNQQINNSSYSVDEEPDIIGFRKYIKKLVAKLTDLDYQGLRGISILGKHGFGKTTFATAIYRSREARGYFDCRAWGSCLWEPYRRATEHIGTNRQCNS